MVNRSKIGIALVVVAVIAAAIFLIGKATARTDVSAVVSDRNWSVTVVLEKPVQSNDKKWESDCTGPNCQVVSCQSQYTGQDKWVTDRTKVTENAPICKMVDDPSTKREVTDNSSCHSVPDQSACTTKVDPGTCKLGKDGQTHCDKKTVCDTKTVCDKKIVYDKKKVCNEQPDTYGQSATPIYANMCNVIVTTWVQDGDPLVTVGKYNAPFNPTIDWSTHAIGARQKSYVKAESASFKQNDGQIVNYTNGLFSGFDENLWSQLTEGQQVILTYNGFGILVGVKLAAS